MRAVALLLSAALSAHAERPEGDDPRGRMRALELERGPRTPEDQLAILRVAEQEAGRRRLRTEAAVQGAAWINIGPTTADYEFNGGTYFKIDSGRARKILVDPNDANIVYLATSGGGVWKTYDALTAVTSSSGPHWQPITESIGSLSIGSMAMNPTNSSALLLGLGDPFDVHTPGLLHSEDGGATWSSAAALSGSYVTGGGIFTATSVRDIAFDPGGLIVFAATDAGLFRATDGGVTASSWSLVKFDGTFQDANSVVHASGNTWLATTCAGENCVGGGSSKGRLWRSNDQGVTWTNVTAQLGTADVERMTLAAAGATAYLLAADGQNGDQKDVFKSTDSGANWTSLGMTPGGNAPQNPTYDDSGDPNNPYPEQTDLDFMHGQAFYNHMIVVDPSDPNTVFVGGNLSMGRSTDGGSTWQIMTDWLPFALDSNNNGGLGDAEYAHADWHTATIAHVGGVTYFYGGNDGGLIRATDDGFSGVLNSSPGSVAWEDKLNRGIVSHLIYSVATGNERKTAAGCTQPSGSGNIVYGGFQDNGTRLRVTSGGTNYVGFDQIKGGDGFGVGLGCTSGGAVGSNLIGTYASQLSYSDDGGGTFHRVIASDGTGVGFPLDTYYTFVMRVATDLTAPRTYLTPLTDTSDAGYVFQSTDGGHTWSNINGTIHRAPGCSTCTLFSFPLPMRNVAADSGKAGAYVAVGLSRAYVTVNGGADWFETPKMATTGTDYLELQTAAFDPGDATGGTIWVGSKKTRMSGGVAIPAGSTHVYKCTTAAANGTAACTAKGAGAFATLPVNVIKVDPGDSNTIYVGTEIGLYRSTDGGATFNLYGHGLPLVSVTDIAVSADGSSLRISTYGRGFWEINNSATSPAGVAGNGDFDFSQAIDGYDLVRESVLLFTDSSSTDYNPVGNLTGSTNKIDESDLTALTAKLGGRP